MMPLYSFTCDCGEKQELLATFAELQNLVTEGKPTCARCGLQMNRSYSPHNTRSPRSQAMLDDVNRRYGRLPQDYMGNDRRTMRAWPGPHSTTPKPLR